MKIDSEAVDKIEELKGWYHDLTDAKNAYKCEETAKKIREYVGGIHSKEMKALVVSAKETIIAEPECPTGQNVMEEKKAIWGKEYDLHIKRNEKCDQDKAKAFEVVWGRCTEAMKNRIEKLGTYETIEETNDIIELMKAIKVQVFDANEKKHPSLRVVLTWRKLCSCRQYEDEDLIDYCQRFVGVVEMVELSYGGLKPKDDDTSERRKFISMMFVDGVDKKQCGSSLKI